MRADQCTWGALEQPRSVCVQQSRRRHLPSIWLPLRLSQTLTYRLAIQIQFTRDGRQGLTPPVPLMDRFPLLLADHALPRVPLRWDHGSACCAADRSTLPSTSIVRSFASMGGEYSFTAGGDYWVTADKFL